LFFSLLFSSHPLQQISFFLLTPHATQTAWRHEESVEQRILLRGLSHVGATLTFDDWIAHWSLLALNEPAATQVRTG